MKIRANTQIKYFYQSIERDRKKEYSFVYYKIYNKPKK